MSVTSIDVMLAISVSLRNPSPFPKSFSRSNTHSKKLASGKFVALISIATGSADITNGVIVTTIAILISMLIYFLFLTELPPSLMLVSPT
jgi:hypothetical protein